MWLRVLTLLILLTIDYGYAANDRVKARSTQYKCHLELRTGEKLVNYMMSKDNYAKNLQRELVAGYIYAKDGKNKRYVKQVFECVLAKDDFVSADARLLDKQTLH